MFFDLFEQLCRKKGVSCKRAVIEMGLSHSIASKWKKTGATPESSTLVKVANYFEIPLNELVFSLESNDLVVAIDNLSEDEKKMLNAASVSCLLSEKEEEGGSAELLTLYGELNDAGKKKLVDYAQDLVVGGRYRITESR